MCLIVNKNEEFLNIIKEINEYYPDKKTYNDNEDTIIHVVLSINCDIMSNHIHNR